MDEERGKRYATLDELKAAVRASVEAYQPVPRERRQQDDEREARDILMRLRQAAIDAVSFAEKKRGQGLVADWLRMFAPLRIAPLLEIPAVQAGTEKLPPLVAPQAELSTIIGWWDESPEQPDDREMAKIALRVGYWPEMTLTDQRPKATVADVISNVRRAVIAVRRKKKQKGK